jgi:hypothetical protein
VGTLVVMYSWASPGAWKPTGLPCMQLHLGTRWGLGARRCGLHCRQGISCSTECGLHCRIIKHEPPGTRSRSHRLMSITDTFLLRLGCLHSNPHSFVHAAKHLVVRRVASCQQVGSVPLGQRWFRPRLRLVTVLMVLMTCLLEACSPYCPSCPSGAKWC